jgi:hypothetical protein
MQRLEENQVTKVAGHIKIVDPETGEVFVDKRNAINYENMSIALAYSLAGITDGDGTTGDPYNILQIGFGNGGVNVTGTGALSYRATNTGTVSGTLYNQTYVKGVASSQTADTENNMSVSHVGGNNYSDVVITATLGYNEPSDQMEFDTATDSDGNYVFDELGIKLRTGEYISHVIFHPVQKSANRKIQVIYTVRITAGS